ncbi:MAG: Gfo/Idh/MocA family protein [Rhodospirillaceae bacterium]
MINWLVVGAGQAGRCHIAAIQKTPEAVLVGVVDPYSPRIVGVPFFEDLISTLDTIKVDAVVIATPNDIQIGSAIQVLKSGTPVLCEKPVGRNVQDARRLLAFAEEKNIPIGVVLNQRAHRHCRWIKSLIDSGTLKPTDIIFSGIVAGLTGWHNDITRAGGGILRTIGLHYIDLLMWLLGPLENISLDMTGTPLEHKFCLKADFSTDCRAEIRIMASAEISPRPVECLIEAGDVSIQMIGHKIIESHGLPHIPEPEPVDKALSFGPGHLAVISEATRCLQNNEPFPVSLSDIMPLLECIDDIYEAQKAC